MKNAQYRLSMILLAYNQERTVRHAAASCLAQDSEPIEIVFSDDASTDGTFAILQEMARDYRGPHRVWARRNASNEGIAGHYNRLLEASQGQLLATAAGDDVSEPDRARRLLAAWESSDCRVDLIASHVIDLDDNDRLHDVLRVDDLSVYRSPQDWAAKRPHIIGASHAFTRRMMERFGPMAPKVFFEDQVMVFRAIATGGALTVDAPLVQYRRGGTSRKPDTEVKAHMNSWGARHRARELAVMRQLLQDARVVGCEPLVRKHLGQSFDRATYLDRLAAARTRADRWAAYREAAALSHGWRLRKLLQLGFPVISDSIRDRLTRLRGWRHRSGPSNRL